MYVKGTIGQVLAEYGDLLALSALTKISSLLECVRQTNVPSERIQKVKFALPMSPGQYPWSFRARMGQGPSFVSLARPR